MKLDITRKNFADCRIGLTSGEYLVTNLLDDVASISSSTEEKIFALHSFYMSIPRCPMKVRESVSLLTKEHKRTRKKITNKNEQKKREEKKKIEFYDGDDD